jgi:cell wall-associated NlpC family hydrolase
LRVPAALDPTGPLRHRLRSVLGRPALATTLVALVLGSGVPVAAADPHLPPVPTRQDVTDARRAVSATTRSVQAIQASLLLAQGRLERSSLVAEQASEAYNGARWRLQVAETEVRSSVQAADRARRSVTRQRRAIGALMAASYQQSSQLTALGAMIRADGPEGVLNQYAAFQGASESLQADYDAFAAAVAVAKVFARKAHEARARQLRLVDEAAAARREAARSAQQALTQEQAVAAERDRLVAELAAVQAVSYSIAADRQQALEERARRRAAEQARREAEAAARAEAARRLVAAAAEAEADEAPAAAPAAPVAPAPEPQPDAEVPSTGVPTPIAPPSPPAPAPPPAPPPPLPPTPEASRGAEQAVAFARAQLGEPYRWAAAGPSAWDCSGLMMGAWAAGGVSLPHYSAAQYAAGTPITAGDLRPGDLVFWATSSSPASIHHVAMYLGDGLVLHAPRTGRPVSIDSMYYWVPPRLFARVG